MTLTESGRFRLCVLANAVYSLGAGVPPTVKQQVGFEKEESELGFRVGNREEFVLLSVCIAQTRYS